MSVKNFTKKLVLIMSIFLLVFITASHAQRGRGRHYGHRYYHGRGAYYHPYVSVGFRTGYYRHYGSYYYRHHYGFYRPFIPRFGVRVMVLPSGYRRIYAGSYPYYYYDGVYYAPVPRGGYQAVKPPIGARVSELPGDAQTVLIDGRQYYVSDGTYYREVKTADNGIGYEVANTDGMMNRDGNFNSDTPDNYVPQTGDRVNKLPSGSRSVVIKGKKYYESPDGIYYEEIISLNKVYYEVVSGANE
jgi:hypothetical protein